LAERAVLVPVGASLVARDNLVASVREMRNRYSTRTSLERELKRYERRGATARNRFERRVRKTRTLVERELRQRRRSVERSFRQNRRRLEREVRLVRRDLEKQSDTLSNRVEKILGEAQGRLNSVA
jgi:F0F1-type ATP synthase membrane subunit b/b'